MRYVLTVLAAIMFIAANAQAQLYEPITAKDIYTEVEARAKTGLADDVYLVNVIFGRIDVNGISFTMNINDGKATGWVYRFRSPSLDETTYLVALKTLIGNIILDISPDQIGDLPFDPVSKLEGTWVDSPDALTGAKAGGAADFLNANPGAEVLTMVAFNNPVETPLAPAGKFWVVQFGSPSTDTLTCGVYAEDGSPYQCGFLTDVEGIPASQGFRLNQSYPNPVSIEAGIPAIVRYAIASSGNIKLTLIDALGREVRVLYRGFSTPGEYRAEINTGVFTGPGLYFYRIETPTGSQTRRLIVVK